MNLLTEVDPEYLSQQASDSGTSVSTLVKITGHLRQMQTLCALFVDSCAPWSGQPGTRARPKLQPATFVRATGLAERILNLHLNGPGETLRMLTDCIGKTFLLTGWRRGRPEWPFF